MKARNIFTTLVLRGSLIGWAPAAAPRQRLGAKEVRLDKAKFVQNVKAALDGKVMGYQVVLLDKGLIAAETAGGRARNAADGEAAMTLNTPANIGSTAKFFAGVALLKLLSSPKGYVNPAGRTLDQWLDMKMYVYLPKVWQDFMHESWKQVSLRELLQHKSGIRALTKE